MTFEQELQRREKIGRAEGSAETDILRVMDAYNYLGDAGKVSDMFHFPLEKVTEILRDNGISLPS